MQHPRICHLRNEGNLEKRDENRLARFPRLRSAFSAVSPSIVYLDQSHTFKNTLYPPVFEGGKREGGEGGRESFVRDAGTPPFRLPQKEDARGREGEGERIDVVITNTVEFISVPGSVERK